jgi:hypothetical protein
MANAWAGPAGGSGARSLTFVSDSSSTKGQFIAALQRMQAMQADLIQPNAETLALFGKFWKSYSIGSADGDKCTDTHWSKALIASMINDASGKNDLSSEMQWSKFAPFLDTIYAQQRKQRGKEAGSRPFTGIEVENASAAKKYDFPNAWISPMKDMFAQNRCILLGVMNPVTDKGHAVALRREASSYELMDPNFGVFACKDWDTLERFLYMLFGNMKLTTASKVIVGPVYGASAEQKVDWTVFRRASTGAAVAAVGAQ